MSRALTDLRLETRILAVEAIRLFRAQAAAQNSRANLLVYYTLRTCREQACLYRQSASTATIRAKQQSFRDRGFDFLADVIEEVGPQNGKHVTNAAPGESWHNYADAFDAVPELDGVALWEKDEYWEIYGAIIKHLGMDWGGYWVRFSDKPHAQRSHVKNPLQGASPERIRELLVENRSLKG
jgi:peptidoglycan L-alanyl-D-glutamate endopeptidase CwlK